MSTLILKRFQCVVDTDEVGSESPYFLTFVGDLASGKSAMKPTRQGNWHNEVDKGEIWTVNDTVTTSVPLVPATTVVLSAMVEEDEGVDINESEIAIIRTAMDGKLKSLRLQGHTTAATAAGPLRLHFLSAISLALSTGSGADDDLMGVKRVTLKPGTGDLSVVPFKADTGFYNVRYAVA